MLLVSISVFAKNTEMTPMLLDLSCNNMPLHKVVETLEDKKRQVWVDDETLLSCHLQHGSAHSIQYHKKTYYLLNDIVGKNYSINNQKLTLDVDIPASNYPENDVELNQKNPKKIRPKQPGAYINYDLTAQRVDLTKTNNLSGLTTLNYFNKDGVGQLQYFLQHENNTDTAVRLDTNWTLDEPEKMASWRFGDSITGTDIWTGAVRFGGIQYATNFATQPNFITFPLPAVQGQAVVPTSVDFYLNNQLMNSQNVNPGAFDIQGLPVITGAGDIMVQTQDITGQQTVVAVPYYASPTLLKKGLTDFSYELGMIRNDYGIESNDYSDPSAVITYKEGLSNDFTAGLHSEILAKTQDVGLSGAYILDNFAVINTAAAVSNDEGKSGGLLLAGIQRQTPRYNLGFQAETTSHDFWQVGLTDDELSPKFLLQSSASVISSKYGTLSVSYTNRDGRTEPVISIATLGYNLNLTKRFFLNINYVRQYGSDPDKELYFNIVYSPAPSYTASASLNSSDIDGTQGVLQFSKNLPTDNGFGYNLSQTTGGDPQTQANLIAQSDYGQYQAKYSYVNSTNNYELDANGAVVLFDDRVKATRQITDSFAMVDLPGQVNVPVYFSNQLIGNTDSAGYAFIPNIRAYQDNQISIDPNTLPLNTTITKAKVDVTPYYHSGVLVKFPIKVTYNYDFKLISSTGHPLSAGSMAYIKSLKKYYPIGYDGEIYISTTSPLKNIIGNVSQDNNVCEFSIPITHSNKAIQQLGSHQCT